MKKQTSPTIVAGLALATLLSCGTGLTKAEPHHDLAHQIETDLVQIEVEALLGKFKELTNSTHQLELEKVNLEVEAETARGEEERAELEQHLRRAHMTQERLEHLRRETREKLHHIAAELAIIPASTARNGSNNTPLRASGSACTISSGRLRNCAVPASTTAPINWNAKPMKSAHT